MAAAYSYTPVDTTDDDFKFHDFSAINALLPYAAQVDDTNGLTNTLNWLAATPGFGSNIAFDFSADPPTALFVYVFLRARDEAAAPDSTFTFTCTPTCTFTMVATSANANSAFTSNNAGSAVITVPADETNDYKVSVFQMLNSPAGITGLSVGTDTDALTHGTGFSGIHFAINKNGTTCSLDQPAP